jgi:hypothetical protein
MGLIFLRHTFNWFLRVKAGIEPMLANRQEVARPLMEEDFAQKAATDRDRQSAVIFREGLRKKLLLKGF